MNWLLILVMIWIAGNTVWGICRGFFRVVCSMAAWLLMLVLVTWATPFIEEVLKEHTRIDERIEAGCEDKLRALVRGADAESDETDISKKGQEKDSLSDLGIKLPEVFVDQLLDAGESADHLLDAAGVYTKAAKRAGDLAMRGLSFVLVLLITWIAFHILVTVLDLVAKLPVIGEVNHLLGGAAGLLKGILLVWLAFAFIAMGSATAVGNGLILLIYESELLIWLYENNLVLSILMLFL